MLEIILMSNIKHQKKFERWKKTAPEHTRYLAELVQNELVPFFENNGFEKMDVTLGRSDQPVSGDSIELERNLPERIDSVYFTFDKYKRCNFQIGFSSHEIEQPNHFIRTGRLVLSKNETYHCWGKSWWIPSIMWSNKSSRKVVEFVKSKLPQVLDFLENKGAGSHVIAREIARRLGSNAQH